MRIPKALPIAAVLAVVVIVAMAVTARPAAPEVIFKTLDGERISTSDLKGKAVLVNFWATSCVTCVKEMPMLADTQRKFGPKGYVTVAVAMNYDPPSQVAAFAKHNNLPFKMALDTDGSIARGFGDIRLTPTTFLLSKKGEIAKQFVGEPKVEWLHAVIAEELDK